MSTLRHLTVRNLSGLADVSNDVLHYGARAVARRVFGRADTAAVRIIYHWATEVPDEDRPAFLIKICGKIAAWESDIVASTVTQKPGPCLADSGGVPDPNDTEASKRDPRAAGAPKRSQRILAASHLDRRRRPSPARSRP